MIYAHFQMALFSKDTGISKCKLRSVQNTRTCYPGPGCFVRNRDSWWRHQMETFSEHDVQFSCAITQTLLAHHWRVHQCLLTSRFIAPSIPWGVSAPDGKMRKQLLKDHNFLNNSLIFIIENSTSDWFAFQKSLYTIYFNLKNCFGSGERYLTP